MDNWTSGVNCTVWNSLPSVLRDDSLSLNSEHVLAGAEGLYVWTVVHTTRRSGGVL